MTILVCPLSKVEGLVLARAPERVISLLDPEQPSPYTGPAYAGRHLRLSFHDVHVSTSEEDAPTAQHVAELLGFVAGWTRSAPLLVHCRAGIGRSTAGAFIAACAVNPRADELEIARALRAAAPFARPNELLVRLADAALSRRGRMSLAIQQTGEGKSWAEVEAVLRSHGEGLPFEMPSSF